MHLPRVRDADHVVDDVAALPPQLLVEVAAQRRRRLREALRVHRHARLVAVLDDLVREEAILAVLDLHAEQVAVLEDRLELHQHVPAIGREAARQTHHLVERALEVLQVLLAPVVLDRLQLGQPVLVRVGDVHAPADRRDVGRREARDQLAQRAREHDHVRVDRHDDLARRLAHRVVDAAALAHVVGVLEHRHHAGEVVRGAHRVLVAVVGRAVVDHRDRELVLRVLEPDDRLDRVVDGRPLVEQRDHHGHRGLVTADLLVHLAALDEGQVEPEHVPVQEHDEDEQLDRNRHADAWLRRSVANDSRSNPIE